MMWGKAWYMIPERGGAGTMGHASSENSPRPETGLTIWMNSGDGISVGDKSLMGTMNKVKLHSSLKEQLLFTVI